MSFFSGSDFRGKTEVAGVLNTCPFDSFVGARIASSRLKGFTKALSSELKFLLSETAEEYAESFFHIELVTKFKSQRKNVDSKF